MKQLESRFDRPQISENVEHIGKTKPKQVSKIFSDT